MDTTIQITTELLERLKSMKMSSKESYENVIWDLVEDRLEFSENIKKNIEKSQQEIKEGKTISLESIKRKVSL